MLELAASAVTMHSNILVELVACCSTCANRAGCICLASMHLGGLARCREIHVTVGAPWLALFATRLRASPVAPITDRGRRVGRGSRSSKIAPSWPSDDAGLPQKIHSR